MHSQLAGDSPHDGCRLVNSLLPSSLLPCPLSVANTIPCDLKSCCFCRLFSISMRYDLGVQLVLELLAGMLLTLTLPDCTSVSAVVSANLGM